jgi:hypothetical protein
MSLKLTSLGPHNSSRFSLKYRRIHPRGNETQSKQSIVLRSNQVASHVDQIVDSSMCIREPLSEQNLNASCQPL